MPGDGLPARSRSLGEPRFAPDFGARERARHGGGLVVEVRERGTSGNTVTTGARARYECLIDLLYDQGTLGSGRTAERRYQAALWLRDLHRATHRDHLVADYECQGESTGEMSDEAASALAFYLSVVRRLGPHASLVVAAASGEGRLGDADRLCRGLDRLADLRGIV